MQKTFKFAVCIFILCSLLTAGFFIPKPVHNWSEPTVTPLTGDTGFSITLLNPESLEGAFIGTAGFPLPTGFIEGEKQFGGQALKLSGAGAGTQKLCFSLPTYQYGWRGNIYQWDGTMWVKLGSEVTLGDDGSPTLYCSTIYGDGTYALLIGYDPALAPAPRAR
jgi:hypothetical protein